MSSSHKKFQDLSQRQQRARVLLINQQRSAQLNLNLPDTADAQSLSESDAGLTPSTHSPGDSSDEVSDEDVGTELSNSSFDEEQSHANDSADEMEMQPIDVPDNYNPENAVVDVESEGRKSLKNGFLSGNLNRSQQQIMLQTLRGFPFFLRYLPKDPRTLLQTPSVVVKNIIISIAGGKYIHLGFEDNLVKQLKSLPDDLLPNVVKFDLSTDGGQLYRSSGKEFWPIQFRIVNVKNLRPMVAGLYVGKKPQSI